MNTDGEKILRSVFEMWLCECYTIFSHFTWFI